MRTGAGHGLGQPGLVMALLRRGVPLTLLLDLADPAGPQSEDLLAQERLSAAT